MAIKINIEDLNPGAWFSFRDGVKAKLRPFSPSTLDDVRRKTTKSKVEYKPIGRGGRLQRIEYLDIDEDKMQAELWDYVIVDWSGIQDEKGKTIECTRDNKIKLMRNWPEFYQFVDSSIEIMGPDVDAKKESVEKN